MRSRSGLAERGRAVSSPVRAGGGGRVACAGEAGPRSVGAWTGAARASPAVARVGRRPTADLELEGHAESNALSINASKCEVVVVS